jgi:hypothetical protein
MPSLTLENLATMARKARHHLSGREEPPASIEEFERERIRFGASTGRSVAVHSFGAPNDGSGAWYVKFDSAAISDYVRMDGDSKELVTIERGLLEHIRQNPIRTFVLVFYRSAGLGTDAEAAAIDPEFRRLYEYVEPFRFRVKR